MKHLFSHEETLTGIHFYTSNLEFPMAIAERGDWDRTQLSYLNPAIQSTESMIRWCKAHHMDWAILYPLSKSAAFKHPFKYLRYLNLIHKTE